MIPLSAFIVDIGAAVLADLDEAIGRQALWGGDVGTLLVGQGTLDEGQLLSLLSDFHSLPIGPAGSLPPIPEELVALLPPATLLRYRVVPLGTARGELHVATAEPLDETARRQLAQVAGQPLRQVVVTPMRIDEALWRFAGVPLPPHAREALARADGPEAAPDSARPPAPDPAPQAKPYRRMLLEPSGKLVPADPAASQAMLSSSSYFGGGFEEPGSVEDLGYEDLDAPGEPESPPPGMVAVDLIAEEPTWDEAGWDDTALHEAEGFESAGADQEAAAGSGEPPLGPEDDTPPQPSAGTGEAAADTPLSPPLAAEPAAAHQAAPELEVQFADVEEILDADELAELVLADGDDEITEEEIVRAVADDDLGEVPATARAEAEPAVTPVALARIELAQRAVVGAREEIVAPRAPDPRAEPPPEEAPVEPPGEGGPASSPPVDPEAAEGGAPADGPAPAAAPDGEHDAPRSIRAEMAAQLRRHDEKSEGEPEAELESESVRAFRHRGPFPRPLADAAVAGAKDVGELLEIFVRFARQYFERVLVVVVQRGEARARLVQNLPPELESAEVDLEAPGLLQRAHDDAEPVVDVLREDGLDGILRRGVPAAAFEATAIPVRVRRRVVAVLYADDAPVDVDPTAVAEVASFAVAIGHALGMHILRRKRS